MVGYWCVSQSQMYVSEIMMNARRWNVEPTSKLLAKKVLWYGPSSECGKPMNVVVS